MKSLTAVFLLLLLLTGCAERTAPAQELEPAHRHPAETQDAELRRQSKRRKIL